MSFFKGFTIKNLFSSRRKKEHDCYLKNGSCVLEELLALCDGNCRIPIRYFTATEIENAIKHSKSKMDLSYGGHMVTGSLDNRLVLVRFNRSSQFNIHRDIAITAQMSHLKNVLRLIGCCLEYESPVKVYAYVQGVPLSNLLFKKGNRDDHNRKSLSWGSRLRVARDVASAIVFLHTEFTTPIIHKGIKPHIVIIDENSGIAKIVDFSLSISLPPGKLFKVLDSVSGTIGYIAPECLIELIISQKANVYSFGILLFQLLNGNEVHDILKRLDSSISKDTTDFEEDANSNTEEDKVNSAIVEETIDIKNLPTNFVDHHFKEGNVMDIADPIILEEHGIEIQQQLNDYLDLVKKCTADNADDRPYMIHVAKELCRMEKCFHALTLGQN